MILILMAALLLGSLVLLLLHRSKEAWLLLGLVLALEIFWVGILLYVAKKGGISPGVNITFYLTDEIRRWFQYRVVTVGQLGFLVALGRYAFPTFYVLLALNYTLTPRLRSLRRMAWVVPILPAITLILYIPQVFKAVTGGAEWRMRLIVECSAAWIWLYLAAGTVLLILEYFATTVRFFRRRYLARALLPLALAVLFALYCPQDPAQIYLFYQNDYMWLLGLWYLSPALSAQSYAAVLGLTAAAGSVSFFVLLRNAQTYLMEDQEEMVLQRKFDAASVGVSVFVHSMKNQLLANRVLHKRIRAALAEQQPDLEKLRESCAMLDESNEVLLTRMEELYQSVKSKSIYLSAIPAERVAKRSLERFAGKYPDGAVQVELGGVKEILADETHLAEAVYNLLVNAWEATLAAGRAEPVQLRFYDERLYTTIEVADAGVGIERADQKRIFEPFYSSKNSNYNWGMGLYYVRQIAKCHLGHLRVESRPGKGTRFLLLLPKYTARAMMQPPAPGAGRKGERAQ